MRVRDPHSGDTYFSKRRRRYDDGSPRELTFTCYHRLPFLARDRSRLWLIEAMDQQRRAWRIDIWAYVIMPEHVHLLVAPREPGTPVGQFAGKIKEQVARRGVAWLAEHAPQWLPRITVAEGRTVRRRFWQPGGGYDRNLQEPRTLAAVIEYLHANPVRRKLVERPLDWPWSSAQWYAGWTPVPLDMDRTLPAFD